MTKQGAKGHGGTLGNCQHITGHKSIVNEDVLPGQFELVEMGDIEEIEPLSSKSISSNGDKKNRGC